MRQKGDLLANSVAHSEPACNRVRSEVELLSTPRDVDLDRRFFPRSKLAVLLTKRTVQEILDCRCPRCQLHIDNLGSHILVPDAGSVIGSGESSAIVLLALLVYIECPQFISAFLQKRFGDQELQTRLDDLSSEYVRQTFWPEYDESQPENSHILGTRFQSRKYQFAIPTMNDDLYTEYHESVILPFIKQRPLGKVGEDGTVKQQGAFSRVFAFEIPQEYRDFQVLGPIGV
jgi:hypothetical protein